MITDNDIRAEGETYLRSLTKLVGKPIKDIHGYIADIGGGATFKLSKVILEDGTKLGIEGEHDFPYLVEWDSQPNFDEDTLQRLYDEAAKNWEAENQ